MLIDGDVKGIRIGRDRVIGAWRSTAGGGFVVDLSGVDVVLGDLISGRERGVVTWIEFGDGGRADACARGAARGTDRRKPAGG